MSLLTLVVVLIVVGFLLYVVQRYIPMEPIVKQILVAVVVIVLILWVLSAFGILPAMGAIRIGK
jgi:hypothetical protein